MADFVAQVEEINALARSAAGFIAQPTLPDEGSVYRALLLLNVSIWESMESLDAFTHQGKHAAALERRGEWFEQEAASPNTERSPLRASSQICQISMTRFGTSMITVTATSGPGRWSRVDSKSCKL
jgi:hypothetical protein